MTEPAFRKASPQPLHSPFLLLGFISLLLVSFTSGATASSSSLSDGPSKRMNRIRVRPRVRGDTRKTSLVEPLPEATTEEGRQLKTAKSGGTTKGGYTDSGDTDTDKNGDSAMNIFDEESSVEDFWTVHESSIDTDDTEMSPSSSPGGALMDYTSAMDTSLFADDESPTDAPAVMDETETPTDTPTLAPIAKEPAPKNSPSTPTGRPSMAPIAISRESDSSDGGNKQTSAKSYAKKKHSFNSKEAYKISNSKSSNSDSNDGANKASAKSYSKDSLKSKRAKKKKHSKKSTIREANKLRKESSITDSFDEEFVSFDEELGSQDGLFDGLAGLEGSPSLDDNNIPQMPATQPTTASVTATDTPTQAPTNENTDSPNVASSEPPSIDSTDSPTSTAEDPQTPMPTVFSTRMPTQEPTTAATFPSAPAESPISSYWTIVERPSMMPATDAASASPTVDTAWVNPYWTIPGMDTASVAAGGKALVPWNCPSNVDEFKSTIHVEFVGSPELLTTEEIYSLEKIVGTLYNAESLAMCDSYVRNLERVELQLGSEGYAFHITASCRDCPLDTTSLLTPMETNDADWFAKFFRSSTRVSPTSNSNSNSYFNLVSQSGVEKGDGLSSRGLNMPHGRRRHLQESSCYCPEDKSPTSPQTVTNKQFKEMQNVAIQELRTAGIITNIESIAELMESK